MTVFPIRRPIEGIRAVLNEKPCHPLIGIRSSLSDDFNNCLWPSEVKLYPLPPPADFSGPSAAVTPAFFVKQTCKPRRVISIPDAGRRDIAIVESIVGESQWPGDWTRSFKMTTTLLGSHDC